MKRRSLGQHYLTDPGVIQRMVDAAAIQTSESVLEVGTGKGVLTERLVVLGRSLEGYEVDPSNYRETLEKVRGGNATIHLADAFQEKPEFDVLVSSLPYSRSQDFVEWICQMEYTRAVVLLQEDFVRKILSSPGNRDYRGVSVLTQLSSQITEIERVLPNAFEPPPRVASLLVSIKPRLRLSEQEILKVKRLFSLRRREVSSALARLGLGEGRGYGRRRVYSLTPREVHEICAK
jgi:16S rRNA A1518/A1519 N6-dimethyltransferase RsmA/KsgA/DIM1 with predicted DNA glycosylase/AP lyase activity